ncbi:MAG TPA: HXXEE domain-containing protein [Candidatus Andersenbacteria bacterium]|nr:HXXEE domain-containing protein [Candidatus Andersenbacteria bacterium]
MISSKLKIIFFISILFFIAHGMEEIFSGFSATDSHVQFVFGYLNTLPTPQATFVVFQIMLWLALIVAALLVVGERLLLWMLTIPGLIFLYELHHFWKAIEVGGYYPGIITAVAFPVLALLFWSEWIKNYRAIKHE